MADEAKFVIDGREYGIPDIDTFTLGEAMVIHDYSGLTLDQIGEETGVHPGLVAAFMHIAYARGNPGIKPVRVRALIEGSSMTTALERFADEAEADPTEPPKSEPETPSSQGSSLSSETSSGNGSTTSSDEPDAAPSPTGTPGSATPDISARVTSET